MKYILKEIKENAFDIHSDNKWENSRVYANNNLNKYLEEGALQQLVDASKLPGVISPVIGMPDIHHGFGLPIGGVMAVDKETGVVSAGGVGMDINCGVRLLQTDIPSESLDTKMLRMIIDTIEKLVPSGVGKKSRHSNLSSHLEDILINGAKYLLSKGYGYSDDTESIEEYGTMKGGRIESVPQHALKENQLSTLGGGNHFIEIGTVDKIYDQSVAKRFNLRDGYTTIMIHTGSRRMGHDICKYYSKLMAEAAPKYGIKLPNKGLAACPINSSEGKRYLEAMICAVNYAFCNRQLITHDVREAFGEVFKKKPEDLGLNLVYDVAHNIAKFEEHKGRKILIHRKGATRALPPGHNGNPIKYLETGHPVIIPGSMGTFSYVLTGNPSSEETFYSVNHGAGRVMSRSEARKNITKQEFESKMTNVIYNSRDYKKLLDEAPSAYKDINDVVNTLSDINVTKKIVRLKPLAVIKGEGD